MLFYYINVLQNTLNQYTYLFSFISQPLSMRIKTAQKTISIIFLSPVLCLPTESIFGVPLNCQGALRANGEVRPMKSRSNIDSF